MPIKMMLKVLIFITVLMHVLSILTLLFYIFDTLLVGEYIPYGKMIITAILIVVTRVLLDYLEDKEVDKNNINKLR